MNKKKIIYIVSSAVLLLAVAWIIFGIIKDKKTSKTAGNGSVQDQNAPGPGNGPASAMEDEEYTKMVEEEENYKIESKTDASGALDSLDSLVNSAGDVSSLE